RITPQPSEEPAAFKDSGSKCTSSSELARNAQDGPPGRTALSGALPFNPPPASSKRRRNGVPIGSSYALGRFTSSPKQKIIVPGFSGVPYCRNHAAPWRTMNPTLANVSTLLTTVGFPNSPAAAG